MNPREHARVRQALARCRVLSVDVFDTALLRLVREPVDVFRLVPGAPRGFVEERVAAERRARLKAAARGHDDITLDEIYDELPAAWDRAGLKARELDVERAVSAAHPTVRDLVVDARALGKRVVFVSDMYLPEAFLAELLREAGYDVDDESLFVSSTHRVSKGSGRLYERMLTATSARPSEVLHIGDNRFADFEQARRVGFRAVLIERTELRAERSAPAGTGGTAAALARGASTRSLFANGAPTDFWHRFGYRQAALYFGFAEWLRDSLVEDGFDHVYFLSRDGHIMRRVFEAIGADRAISTSYLYASRRAFNIPAISQLDEPSLRFLEHGSAGMRVRHFLERVHLDAIAHVDAIRAVGFAGPEVVVRQDDAGERARLRALFQRLEGPLLARAAEERAMLLRYLAQEGVLGRRRVAVVDLGWHGTLQESLASTLRMTGHDISVYGYYLGTFEGARGREDRGHPMRAYLFKHGRPVELAHAVTACVEIYELLHAAPHGTVVRFEERDGRVVPVLAPHEAPAAQLAVAMRAQEAALAGVVELAALRARIPSPLRITPDDAVADLRRVLTRPTIEEARHLGNIVHADGFGDLHLTRPLARPPSLTSIILAPRAAWDGYFQSFWKEGYVTRLIGRDERLRRVLGAGLKLLQSQRWTLAVIRTLFPDRR
jgi:HAD superfamily hydrolase (TIGR01549 family)